MSSMDDALPFAPRPSLLANLTRLMTSARFLVYCCCTLAALLTTYHMGKDMAWDTLDYHFYAGFSALHDRFGQDYFPAGPQSYLNPYVLVPFYVLAASGLTALQVALILGAVHSVILWLVYELALVVAPPTTPRARLALGACAVTLAGANSVLIIQFGTSFADILTAEIVLAGWLVLVGAVRAPGAIRVCCAALLLGCATAMKLSNGLPAVAAGVMVLFVPAGWRGRFRYAAVFVAAGIAGFAVVAAPWSIRLQEHFGNPFFPLLNGIFRSPQFTTAPVIHYRFIPPTLGAALWRPFAIATPRALIHTEYASPDLRYVLLLVAAALSLVAWGWKRRLGKAAATHQPVRDGSGAALAALGSAFLVDWALWLKASGNSRYFIPMACVAAVLAVVLLFRFCSDWPRVRNYLLLAFFIVQFYQLHFGTQYPPELPWDPAPWFEVSLPKSVASDPELYFSIGMESASFIVPYLAKGSGFINLEGNYTLGPDGANGRHIAELVGRYSPKLRMLMRDPRRDAGYDPDLPNMVAANDALEPFGLQVDTSQCERIIVRDVSSSALGITGGHAPATVPRASLNMGYFITCRVATGSARDPALASAESAANLAFDHLEDACPALFQPRRPATYFTGTQAHGYIWERQYANTDIFALIHNGWVRFQPYMSPAGLAGAQSAWEKTPPRVNCGRGSDGYFFRVKGPR